MADDTAWPPGAGEPGSPHGSPPFAGRQLQLAHLAAEFERARDGGIRLTLVHGEAGIGKSRLVSEFIARITTFGPALLFGRCDQEGLIPYQPIVEALRDHLSSEGGDATLANLGPEWSELRRLLPGEADDGVDGVNAAQLSPATRRYQLFESVVTLVSIASRGRPLVLVLEDLHWSDQPLLGLLRHLLRTRRLRGVHMVATYRESDLDDDHPLHAFLADTGHDDSCTALSLGGLSEAEVGELFDAVVPASLAVRDEYLRHVLERTDGNPFFVLEMLRHLRENGASGSQDGVSELPGGVRELVTFRMRSLQAEVREVLGVAAVIGHHFDFTLLQRVLEFPASQLLDLLGAAERSGHLAEGDGEPGQFRFAHAISRDAVYATLEPGERAAIHHRVGTALEGLGAARTTQVPEQLAYHFERSAEAHDAERAVQYARIAGERALNAFAFEDAVGYFEAALRAQERMESPSLLERCELLLNLGRAQAGVEGPAAGTARGREGAIATFTRAAILAREIGAHRLMVHAAVDGVGHWLEGTGSYGRLEEGLLRLNEDVLSWLPRSANPERLEVLVHLHGLYTAAAKIESRRRCTQQIAEIVASSPDPQDRLTGEIALALEVWEGENWRDARAGFERCLADPLASRRPDVLSRALFLRMRCVARLGDIGEMQSTTRRIREYADEFRDPILRVWAECLYAGGFAFLRGDVEGAFSHNRKAVEAASEIGSRHIIVNMQSQRFYLLNIAARWDRVRAAWPGWLRNAGPYERAVVAWSSVHARYLAVAHHQFAQFETGGLRIPDDRHRVNILATLSEAAALAGRVELGEKLYDDLAPAEEMMFDCGSPAFIHGPVGRPLGMLASLLQRWDAADAHFESATRAAEKMQHRAAVADTTFEHARSLVARSQWGHRGRARDMAEFAEAEARFMGYARLERDAAGLLESMGRGAYPAGLSEREVNVLRLVARGLSNREIADELVVSPATVATHVRHIFEKTASANRAQAVAFAVRHYLT